MTAPTNLSKNSRMHGRIAFYGTVCALFVLEFNRQAGVQDNTLAKQFEDLASERIVAIEKEDDRKAVAVRINRARETLSKKHRSVNLASGLYAAFTLLTENRIKPTPGTRLAYLADLLRKDAGKQMMDMLRGMPGFEEKDVNAFRSAMLTQMRRI